jgi:hypothetical protein
MDCIFDIAAEPEEEVLIQPRLSQRNRAMSRLGAEFRRSTVIGLGEAVSDPNRPVQSASWIAPGGVDNC